MEKVKPKSNTQHNILAHDKLTDDELEDLHLNDLKTEEPNNSDPYGDLSNSETETNEETLLSMEKKRGALKKGDYIVQCHIIEGRDLKGRGWNAMSDPVVVVEVMNQKQSTEIKKDCVNAVFDQVLFFELKNLEKQQINEGKCKISVFDANSVMRNVLIGSYEFDLSTIYFSSPYHEVYKQWIGLFDTTDEYEGLQGYLRVSIVVLGPNDEQKTHDLVDEDESEINLLSVLLPPEIEQIPYLLTIKIYECKDLCSSDIGFFSDACDPFAIAEFGSIRLQSKVKKGINVNLMCELQIPVLEPLMCSVIKISFYDWNATKRNDRIASLSFEYKRIKSAESECNTPQWYTLYGAPLGYQRGVARSMNQGFVEGTEYRGQALLSLNVTPQKVRPKKGIADISLSNDMFPKMKPYLITCDLYEGSEINKMCSLINSQMYVQICIGRYCAKSKKVNVKDGRCEWFQVITTNADATDKNIIISSVTEALLHSNNDTGCIGPVMLPIDTHQCPDIFIYLCCSSSNKRISYLRIPFHEIYNHKWKNAPKWYNLKEDKAINALDNDTFPGSLLLSLNCGFSENLPKNNYLPQSRPFAMGHINLQKEAQTMPCNESQPQQRLSSVGNLIVYIQQAQNLPAMDTNGKSDPYVKLTICDNTGNILSAKSTVVPESLNPKWYEQFTFNDVPIGETLKIKIFDKDTLKSDDLLGSVEILLVTQSNRASGVNFDVKNWFFINHKYPDSKIQCRLKFEFISHSELNEKLLAKNTITNKFIKSVGLKKSTGALPACGGFGHPTKKSMQLRINLYQARNLLATDSNGLCDPYVVIRCCGQITKSKIINATLDPQWYETLVLNVLLPQPLSIAPDIHIQVFDSDKFSKDDVVGRFIMKPKAIGIRNEQTQPKWYTLCNAEGETLNNGEILLSFQLIVVSHNCVPIVENLIPKSTEQYLQIVTLGLRDLNSVIAIHKPYIKFHLNDKVFKTKKSNQPSSINPNFLQILKIKVSLPNEYIFAPSLRITVKDSLFGGVIRRNIGCASVSLQDLLENTQKFVKTPPHKLDRDITEVVIEEKKENEMGITTTDIQEWLPDSTTETEIIINAKSENENIEMRQEIVIDTNESDTNHSSDEQTCLLITEEKKEDIADSEDQSFDLEKEQKIESAKDIPEYMINRAIIDNELEDKVSMNPFLEIPIFCGQTNSKIINKYRKIGYFKGLMELTKTKKSSELNQKINIKQLLTPKNLFIRLYVLKGIRLTPKDSDGSCDPYLIIKFGKKYKISTRSHYIKNTLNPEFFEAFEIQCTIPGPAKLTIEVWDWDGIGDDLVGITQIDIEDRWFSESWHDLGSKKPLEIRTLHSQQSSFAQGKLEVWLDIFTDTQAKQRPLINIKPPPPTPFELRVIIWECKDVTIKDTITQMNDLYVTGLLENTSDNIKMKMKTQSTDLHFRSQKGFGSFNWRMKFSNFELPSRKLPRFRLQIWDKDYWSANDSICEAYLSLSGIFKLALRQNDRIVMKSKGKDAFWINDLKHPNFAGNQGKIKVSFECMPMNIAQQLPAGYGRSEPNMNPFLPDPKGRAKFSIFSPFRSLRYLLGDKIACKLCVGFLISAIMSSIFLIAPTLISSLIANAMTGF